MSNGQTPRSRPLPDFLWATGIEDTFITDPWPATGRTLEEYELTQHYLFWREDFQRIAELGVNSVRYGIPWYRVNPHPGAFDWSWTDEIVPALIATGAEPIIDLVHYGTPAWLEGSFLHPDYPARVAEYASAFAARYRGALRWYTPLNEPRINAWYCGRTGLWPPYRRGWRGFVAVLAAISRGIVLTERALRGVGDEIRIFHVDATDLYETDDPTLETEAARRQELVFLAIDWILGRFGPDHPLWDWVRRHGITDAQLAWFQENRVRLDVIGINEYPLFSLKRLVRGPRGLRQVMPYAPPETLAELGRMYWRRYGLPIMITETADKGPVRRRARWLDDSIGVVRRLRAEGVECVGYTWWPMFALVTWPYRTGARPAADYLVQMGLWDLRAEADGTLTRVRTELIDRYRSYTTAGAERVGHRGTGSLDG
jgi:beta-glucosidase/6-phospho-beta-glucosidase/beta-galactosidase